MLLTERELTVMQLVLQECDNHEIAQKLGIKAATVKSYKSRIARKYRQLGFNSLLQFKNKFENSHDEWSKFMNHQPAA